jgi:phenylpyruvate tautomerase PptA (4-oxalocrotonate tautomerase family)
MQGRLVAVLTEAITEALGCSEGVVSIALEPVDKDDWNEQVYVPEIVGRKELLIKQPNY